LPFTSPNSRATDAPVAGVFGVDENGDEPQAFFKFDENDQLRLRVGLAGVA
jgi:hypothetical protein